MFNFIYLIFIYFYKMLNKDKTEEIRNLTLSPLNKATNKNSFDLILPSPKHTNKVIITFKNRIWSIVE